MDEHRRVGLHDVSRAAQRLAPVISWRRRRTILLAGLAAAALVAALPGPASAAKKINATGVIGPGKASGKGTFAVVRTG